jgi:hypothetical protein
MHPATDYSLLERAEPLRDTGCLISANKLLLAVLLGVGAHAGKESLAPAEPALESLGLGPMAYALLTVMPIAMGVVTPMLWGALFDKSPRWVLLLAPMGEFAGAFLVAVGLNTLKLQGSKALAGTLCLLGLFSTSVCKSGIAIAQFSIVGRSCAGYTALSFTLLIVTKHFIGMVVTWYVPLIVANAKDDLAGIFRVQVTMLLPHVVATAAGIALHLVERYTPTAPRRQESLEAATAVNGEGPADQHHPTVFGFKLHIPGRVALALGLWRAFAVGTLHA